MRFSGGWIAKFLFEEMRYCFVYGQFVAVVILGMAFVELTLAALFYAAGRSDLERTNLSALLREAVALGWVTKADFQGLNGARVLRNAVAHFRRPLHGETVEYKSVTQGELPYSILEEDARLVVQTVFGLFMRNTVF